MEIPEGNRDGIGDSLICAILLLAISTRWKCATFAVSVPMLGRLRGTKPMLPGEIHELVRCSTLF